MLFLKKCDLLIIPLKQRVTWSSPSLESLLVSFFCYEKKCFSVVGTFPTLVSTYFHVGFLL